MNLSTDILPMVNSKKRKPSLSEIKNGIIERLSSIFSSSSSYPIDLEYKDRVFITKCLEKILPEDKKSDPEEDAFLSTIKKNLRLSFEQEEYKEREKRLFKQWAIEEQREANKNYNKANPQYNP